MHVQKNLCIKKWFHLLNNQCVFHIVCPSQSCCSSVGLFWISESDSKYTIQRSSQYIISSQWVLNSVFLLFQYGLYELLLFVLQQYDFNTYSRESVYIFPVASCFTYFQCARETFRNLLKTLVWTFFNENGVYKFIWINVDVVWGCQHQTWESNLYLLFKCIIFFSVRSSLESHLINVWCCRAEENTVMLRWY